MGAALSPTLSDPAPICTVIENGWFLMSGNLEGLIWKNSQIYSIKFSSMIPAFNGLYAVLLKLRTHDSFYQAGLCHAGLCHAGFPMPPRTLSGVPGSAFCVGNNAPTPVVTIKSVPRRCQVPPGGGKCP